MDYIISGGLGFIGKNLVSDKLGNFAILDRQAGCDLCKVDVRIPPCKTFIHLAALTNVRSSLIDPISFISENCGCTLKCLDFALNCDAKFIFASSMGAAASMSPYSASKLACEAYCTAYRESYGLNVKILRFASVYGPHSVHKDSVIPTFIKQALEKRPLSIFGLGNQTRDFIYVDDVIDAIFLAATSKTPTIMSIGSGKETSIIKLAKMIQELSEEFTNYRPPIVHSPAIDGEILYVDPKTDIEPKISLQEGLTKTFEWYLKHYEKPKRLEPARSKAS